MRCRIVCGLCLILAIGCLSSLRLHAAAMTWVFTVQVTTEIQESPPQITLRWLPDPYGAKEYTVYRKAVQATEWGEPLIRLGGSATSYTDNAVVQGTPFEYQVTKRASLGYNGYGYVSAGIRVPPQEQRSTVLLIVETNTMSALGSELARLRQDLVGDGWQVRQAGVSSNDSPQSVRARILDHYRQAPAEVNTVFLLGHVPVFMSGNLDYDTHGPRPLPADGYYGYTLDDWNPDPLLSPSFFPSDVTLNVGRVDFFNMPGLGARKPWPNETELLRNYLTKDHLWRHGQLTVPRRALMGNSRGDEDGESVAATGYRAFSPTVGPENVVEANVEFSAPARERWISHLAQNSFLWAYGCGGGSPDGCGGLGTNIVNRIPGLLRSRDVVEVDAKAVFVMLFGSWFADWTLTDNLMRSFLATRTLGLAAASAGRPQWYMHHMAQGETIGYSARLSMNNETLYLNQSNGYPRAIFQSLMGDPTLRLEPIPPPSNLTARNADAQVLLEWSPSPASVEGYYVYRAAQAEGPFARITPSLLSAAAFTDPSPPPGSNVYMVRAIALQKNPSGSYYNPSQGIFAEADVPNVPNAPIVLQAAHSPGGLVLTWNTRPGTTYRVQFQQPETEWLDASPPLNASNGTLSWRESPPSNSAQRLYRVISP